MTGTKLAWFNGTGQQDAQNALLACAAVPRWASEVAARRPYPTVEAALEAARTAAVPWTDEEVEMALSRHPRIGEQARSHDVDADHSRREQAGVDITGAEVRRRLEAGNRAYEERFDRVFLIRAAGRSAADILQALEQRLANDPVTEREVVAEQLREIAVLRLQGALA